MIDDATCRCALQVSQPAVLADAIGKGSHDIVQQRPAVCYRVTNFVECQAPMFHSRMLMQLAKHLDRLRPATGFGLDTVWTHIAEVGTAAEAIAEAEVAFVFRISQDINTERTKGRKEERIETVRGTECVFACCAAKWVPARNC